jgi:signal transduction histidine kinase
MGLIIALFDDEHAQARAVARGMDQAPANPQQNERVRAPVGKPGWEAKRPLFWRLPLLAFLGAGVVCLNYLDSRLSSDYTNSAADLAVQADALIESAVRDRAASVHAMRLLVAASPTPAEQRSRLEVLGNAIVSERPEVLQIFRLDYAGDVRQALPSGTSSSDLATDNHLLVAETRAALKRAAETGTPATTGVIVLRNDTLGFVIYDPIIVDERLIGYIGAAVAYAPMLRSLLTPRLQGRFGYRIADSAGRLLAVSPQYPSRVAELTTQRIDLPGGKYWQLAVPIGVFQPRAARVVMWLVGLAGLFIVFLLVLREDARAERIAMHSFNLELLSRDLLDANVRLEERAQQVTEANKAKSRFLANVSHELRTPLNAIVGYNALALSGLYGEVTAELRGAHERIRAAADHLLHVVNDVLDLSKIEVGRMDVDRRPMALEPLLEDVVSMVEPIAEAKGVRLDLVVPRDLPPVVTDARHVRQILVSLMTNAIKFTEQGSVTIVAKVTDVARARSILIAVEDTGIGIAPADLVRIFDEFEQVRPSGRGDSIARGTGLGLAVSRKLARLLGGDVWVDSQLGHGSRFTLTLPLEPVTSSTEADSASATAGAPAADSPTNESSTAAAQHRS